MTYEEWLEEQETLNDVSDTPESNLEPVKANPEAHIENKIKSNRTEGTGALLLDSLLKEKVSITWMWKSAVIEVHGILQIVF